MKSISIEIPWPPSANNYWRRNGSRYFISDKGVAYRNLVYYSLHPYRHYFIEDEKIRMTIEAFAPDKRIRDLDNILKCTMDSLQFARIFPNDFQIDSLQIDRMNNKNTKNLLRINLETINVP